MSRHSVGDTVCTVWVQCGHGGSVDTVECMVTMCQCVSACECVSAQYVPSTCSDISLGRLLWPYDYVCTRPTMCRPFSLGMLTRAAMCGWLLKPRAALCVSFSWVLVCSRGCVCRVLFSFFLSGRGK